MPLTDAQLQLLEVWMRGKGVRRECPACGHAGWAAGDIVRPPIYVPGSVSIAGSSVPVLQLICTNCAYIMAYSAVHIGLAT